MFKNLTAKLNFFKKCFIKKIQIQFLFPLKNACKKIVNNVNCGLVMKK